VCEKWNSLYVFHGYVDGGALSRRLRDRACAADEAARLVARPDRAIDYAHSRGILHRELKPSNILFDKVGTPKIIFGLRRDQFRAPSIGATQSGRQVADNVVRSLSGRLFKISHIWYHQVHNFMISRSRPYSGLVSWFHFEIEGSRAIKGE
jgi:serine/threonine protein kinase